MIDLDAKVMSGPVIRLHPDDDVVVARADIEAGTSILVKISSRQVSGSHRQIPALFNRRTPCGVSTWVWV